MYSVYIIYSKSHDVYYKGISTDINKRLQDHNINRSTYTRNKGPWILLFLRSFSDKSKAFEYERMLKRQNRKYILWLIDQDLNELK